MVDGDIKESLLLIGVEIHRDEAVYTGHAQQVGYQFGADGYTRFVFAVLTGPAEIWYHGNDAPGRCALGGVYHQEQLHEIVRVGEGGLHKENVASADGLFVGYREFAVGKFRDLQFSKGAA